MLVLLAWQLVFSTVVLKIVDYKKKKKISLEKIHSGEEKEKENKKIAKSLYPFKNWVCRFDLIKNKN